MNELQKNQFHETVISGLESNGAGVARIMGRAVFVPGTLPGERWKILILKVTASAVYGKGVELLEPSTARQLPACPAFGMCGGCDLLHMSYEQELEFKLKKVNDNLRHIGGLDFEVGEIIGAQSIERYRNKAIYNFSTENGRAVFGFYRERSHKVIPIDDCPIQTELSARCARALRDFVNENGILVYDEETGRGQLRRLFTRCSARCPQSVAVIVAARGFGDKTGALVEALRSACPELTGIVLCVNKSRGNSVLVGDFHTLWGSEYIEDELCSLKFRISPLSFYQINPAQAQNLYDRAVSYASPDGDSVAVDLYCGAGTISLCLARRARMVYGAEIVPDAVENARENARANGIENAEFLLGDAGEAARQLQERGIKPDAVVVDPPRKGLAVSVIDTVAAMSPERVVYVSCDSATLARDLRLFADRAYTLQKATAVDMFPRTCHVEAVVLLTKTAPGLDEKG